MTKPYATRVAGMGVSAPSALPQKESAPEAVESLQSREIDTSDFDTVDDERKAFATLQAGYALLGYALHRLEDGCLLIERWGYCRTVDNITQAAQFLQMIGGHHG